jgi:hypothetical protein
MVIELDNGFKASERKCEYFSYTVLYITGANDKSTVARP